MGSIYHGSSRVFYIDSYLRTSGSDTDFSVALNLPENNYNKVCLLQLSIPKNFYNFESGSNSFVIQELGVNYTVTIPVGNYNKNNLLTTLSTLLTSASGHGWTYTCSYPSASQANTGRLTFTVSGNSGNQPSLIFTNGCWLQLGFTGDSTNTFSANEITSVNFISLSPVNRIFVKSSMCATSESSVLQEVLQTFPDCSFIYFQQYDIDSNSKDFTDGGSSSFSFTITDRFGNAINTHGLNVMMSLLLYEKNNTSELQKADLQIQNLQRIYQAELAKLNEIETVKSTAEPISTNTGDVISEPMSDVALEAVNTIGSFYL